MAWTSPNSTAWLTVTIHCVQAFLRPVLDCIRPSTGAFYELDRVQHSALVTALSVRHETGFGAVQMLSGCLPFRDRWRWLVAKRLLRVQAFDGDNMLRRVCDAVQTNRKALMLRNEWWRQIAAPDAELEATQRHLTRQAHERICYSIGQADPRTMDRTDRTERMCLLWRIGRFLGQPEQCVFCNKPDIHFTRTLLEQCRAWQQRLPALRAPLPPLATHLDGLLNDNEQRGVRASLDAAVAELHAIWREQVAPFLQAAADDLGGNPDVAGRLRRQRRRRDGPHLPLDIRVHQPHRD
ncbi:hypothetical protein RI367_008531 [Sorochytrium milnesiophthora]